MAGGDDAGPGDEQQVLRGSSIRYTWNGATPGEHTLVSRVTDATGAVQPTAEEIANKKTFLEDNSQYPRKVTIS